MPERGACERGRGGGGVFERVRLVGDGGWRWEVRWLEGRIGRREREREAGRGREERRGETVGSGRRERDGREEREERKGEERRVKREEKEGESERRLMKKKKKAGGKGPGLGSGR